MSDGFKVDKAAIRADGWLRWMMRIGIPLALISIFSLWAGRYFSSPLLGLIFVVTLPVALTIGFAYNIRYVMLSMRQRKAYQQRNNPKP